MLSRRFYGVVAVFLIIVVLAVTIDITIKAGLERIRANVPRYPTWRLWGWRHRLLLGQPHPQVLADNHAQDDEGSDADHQD